MASCCWVLGLNLSSKGLITSSISSREDTVCECQDLEGTTIGCQQSGHGPNWEHSHLITLPESSYHNNIPAPCVSANI